MTPLILYILLGGSFTIGQIIVSEIGRYEIWSKRERMIVGLIFGALTILISFIFLMSFDTWTYPAFLLGIVATEKAFARGLNRIMPERLQAKKEELKQRYEGAFKIDSSEVDEILEGEKEFIEKLGLVPEGKDAKHRDKTELEELRDAIKKFIAREKT